MYVIILLKYEKFLSESDRIQQIGEESLREQKKKGRIEINDSVFNIVNLVVIKQKKRRHIICMFVISWKPEFILLHLRQQ